jgi:phosphate starvation-inducible PhoH-like protein
MRGTTYDNSIMLMDEAQNSTMTQLMLWVTRLGNNSKAVMMGDVSQYDIKRNDSKFLNFINLYKNDDDIFNFQFSSKDIVRNKFLINIVEKYEKWKDENENLASQEQFRRK